MANLAQFDIGTLGREARIRALLEDLVQAHIGVRPQYRMALAVWFQKSVESNEQYLLELMSGPPIEEFARDRFSLLWKTGTEAPPFVNVRSTSIDHFLKLSTESPNEVAAYTNRYEVLYFDKKLLPPPIVEMFHIMTEPPGLVKGWYVPATEYSEAKTIQGLLARHAHTKCELGLVKTSESADFEYVKGVLNVEVQQKWLPLSPQGILPYTYYSDYKIKQAGYFLFEGGSLYQILKFEVITAPEYANRLLGRTSDDRYPEVYLRAVHQSSESAA